MAREGEWLEALPRSLRQRFDGLGNFVAAVLEEEGLRDNLNQKDVQRIHLLAYLKMLHDFLLDGNDAAKRAVDAFAELGVQSFRIGNQTFEG